MRLGIDCSCLAKRERTGVARYCAALVGELARLLEPDDRVVLLYRVSRLRRLRWFVDVDDPRFSRGYLNDRVLPLHPGNLDVVHGPDVRIPRIPGVAPVATIHDLSALEIPGIAGDRFRRRKAKALEDVSHRAAVILCISQFTESMLLRRFPAASGRTRIVPQGISQSFRPVDPPKVWAARAARGLRNPYVLFVGQVSARKNLRPLVDAFARLHEERPGLNLDLVFAGPLQLGGDEVVAAAKALPVGDRIKFLGYVDETDLPALYTGAEAFCFPSKSEGFGMPQIEAMACGCPVIAARAGANESTAGDAALFFEPDDAAGLAARLARVLDRDGERDALVERGRRRAAQFSWRETTRRTLDAYRDAFEMLKAAGAAAPGVETRGAGIPA